MVAEIDHFLRQFADNSGRQPSVSTPTVSEDGSDDEGATIHGVSPVGTRGASIISPSIKKS
jgi:hypothetical protein